MKMCSVSCEQFTAPVIKPLVIGGELITSRNCARVILNSADGSRFIGEMSPLPHFNNETFAQAFLQLSHFYPSLSQLSFPESLEKLSLFAKKHLTQLYPSVRNAIEMACFSYIESLKDPTSDRVVLNGLVIPGDSDFLNGVDKLLAAGYHSIKVKVGRKDIDVEIDFIQKIISRIKGCATLRLDCNRAWSLTEAIYFGKAVACDEIEYIEEPVTGRDAQIQFFHETGILVALDETLAEVDPETLDLTGVNAFVLKPALIGGLTHTYKVVKYAQSRGIKPVLSSAFETDRAILNYANFAVVLGINHIPHGLDTWKWLGSQEQLFTVVAGDIVVNK